MIPAGVRYGAAAVLLAGLMLGAGCGSDKSTKPASKTVESYVTEVSTEGGTAALKTGALPAATGGPTVSATVNNVVINGGSTQATVAATQGLSRVLVGIQGVDGYYEVTLAQARQQVKMFLTIAQDVPQKSFTFLYGAADADGKISAYDVKPVTVTEVGTGDIQISLAWDKESDVDLHVQPPVGDEIYYGNRGDLAGGHLDLDSNPDCEIDSVRNENITWPSGTAPSGLYTVRVDYFAACDVDTTRYVVTVNQGGVSQTFPGMFTGDGDFGGLGDGVVVTTFQH